MAVGRSTSGWTDAINSWSMTEIETKFETIGVLKNLEIEKFFKESEPL